MNYDAEVITTDVLIIGGGSAGLWAAKRFSEAAPERSALIVDKGPKDWGGLMTMAGGDFDAVLPGEDVDAWVQDLVYYFDGLCNQSDMEEILRRSGDRLRDYQKFGCEFFTKADGTLQSVPQRGLDHVRLYPAKLKGRGGELMVKNLVKQLKDQKVGRLGRIQITELLRHGERIAGAVGFDTLSGKFYVFHAQAVILATGMGGWKTSYGKNTPTGEGVALGYGAGARLMHFEFGRVWNMPRYFGWEGQTTLMPLGGRFINALGESFMDKYSPILGANTDPHYTTIAMAMEIRAGRGPIYFDLSRINPADTVLLRPQNGWQKLNYDKLSALGMDLFRDNTEWVPQMTVSYGGIDADIYGRTGVPGLFAAGTACATEPGVYAGGFALMTTSVTGHLAGEGAAAFLQGADSLPSTGQEAEIARLRTEAFKPLGQQGLKPKEVVTCIQRAMFPYDVSILKTENALLHALREIQRIRTEDVPRMAAADPHYLMKLREADAMAFVSELYLRASLARQETRAGHYREDFPQRKGEPRWLLWSKGAEGKPVATWKTVPLESYKHPVTRYYQDNFRFA
ncbi:MAG: FAD-binding protein [Desulfovibrionaceae bacterium]|nr:FAD-binding protein [Desulfovibrionaceae bacterium]